MPLHVAAHRASPPTLFNFPNTIVMKLLTILALSLLYAFTAHALGEDSAATAEKTVREKILDDIHRNFDTKNRALDSTMVKLDSKVTRLDSIIKLTGSPKERIDRVAERVEVLEEKQKAREQNELNVYEANYQAAIINMVSMDREIKPLILFRSTKDFFNALTETGNPTTYDGFRSGFDKFKTYIDETKEDNPTLNTLASIVNATGNITFGIPLVGAYSQLLFSGMSDYIKSIGHKRRDLKVEADKMFAITVSVSQFVTDKGMVENEWDEITEALQEMQLQYDSVLNRNLNMLGITRPEMTNLFTNQSDADRRYLYLTALREKAANYVLATQKSRPKDWKENIYYQLMDVQSLKLKYGDITYHIKHHIGKYSVLINKYKTNKEIGDRVGKLDQKLNQLKATFDDAFEPIQYVHAATRMYKVL